MDDADFVRSTEAFGDLPSDGKRLVDRKRAAGNAVGQRLALDEFHHQGAILDSVDLRDVRVVERSEHLRLALEARQALRVGSKEVGQDLDRDLAVQARVARSIHLTHAARAQRADDFVGADPRAWGQRHQRLTLGGDWMLKTPARDPGNSAM